MHINRLKIVFCCRQCKGTELRGFLSGWKQGLKSIQLAHTTQKKAASTGFWKASTKESPCVRISYLLTDQIIPSHTKSFLSMKTYSTYPTFLHAVLFRICIMFDYFCTHYLIVQVESALHDLRAYLPEGRWVLYVREYPCDHPSGRRDVVGRP